MKTTLFSFLTVILIALGLSSCMALYKKNTTVKSGSIPADFGKHEATMLVLLEGKNSHDKYLKRNFEKYYTGKYVLITKDELNTIRQGKYADSTQYRYIFYMKPAQSVTVGASNGLTYRLTDRVTVKGYASRCSTGLFSKLMKAYLMNLEKTRKANQS